MKRFLSFFVAIFATISMFAVENAVAESIDEIASFGEGTDMYFNLPSVTVAGNMWNVVIDPALALPADGKYPWGTILTSDDEWEELKIKKGYSACSNLHDFRFCAKLDGSGKQMWEMEAYATHSGVDYYFHFYHNVPEGVSLFVEEVLEADYDITATDWDSQNDKTDTYFYVYGKDADNKVWKFEIDPLAPTTEWVFGATYKAADFDYEYTKVGSSPAGTGKMTEVKTFTMVLDPSEKISYMEAWFVWKEKLIHLHYGEAPAEKEDGEIELVSNDMKDATADRTDIYIDKFTAKDTKGRTWSFCFDPKATGTHYPWGTTMTLADLDDDPKYTYVKLDGEALTLNAVTLFMDLNEDNGKPYLEATILGTLGEQEYNIHVTANKPAPATEITATSISEKLLYNGRAELEFKDAADNSVTIDFAESTIYYDQVYTYTSKQDSIVAIMTKYNGSTEAMNYSKLYNCKANFLVTKGEGNLITVVLSYTTNRDNKYKLTYTGAYTGSRIGNPIPPTDTIQVAIEAAAEEVSIKETTMIQLSGTSADEQNGINLILSVGKLLGDEDAPGKFSQGDLDKDVTKIIINGDQHAVSEANITITKAGEETYALDAYLSTSDLEYKVYHFTCASFTLKKMENPETGINSINAQKTATKILRNGALIIVKDGVEYNVLGANL